MKMKSLVRHGALLVVLLSLTACGGSGGGDEQTDADDADQSTQQPAPAPDPAPETDPDPQPDPDPEANPDPAPGTGGTGATGGSGDTGDTDGSGDSGDPTPGPPAISISDAEAQEPETPPAAQVIFVVALSKPATQPVSVSFATQDASAMAGQDYTANTGQLLFAAGETHKFISVDVLSDSLSEPDENFSVVLSSANNATLADGEGIGTITDFAPTSPQVSLRAGTAEGVLRVPVGTPLGGYLRPPVGGDFIFGEGEDCLAGDCAAVLAELLDFIPQAQEHDGVPLAPVPDELRAIHSPYATYSPPSRGYYDSLITKAVALQSGDDYAVFVKTDLIAMLDEVVVGVRRQVQDATGIDLGDGLIMSGTHTHDGPGAVANNSTRYFWLATDVYQPEVFARLVDEISRVVIAAVQPDNLRPARFGYATGLEDDGQTLPGRLNSFRRSRSPYSDARVAQQDLLRRRIGVLRVDEVGASGEFVKPLAVIMNYAAHGIAFGVENLLFSGDVLASAEREVEAAFEQPVTAMLVQNTGGDVSPRADGGPTLQRIERFGKLLAPQVLDIYRGINNFDTAPQIRAVSQRIILDLDRLGYETGEYPHPWGAAQCNAQPELPERCLTAPPPDATDLADNGVGENGAFVPQDTKVTALKLGSALILAQPGEPLTEYGLRLLEDSPFGYDRTFIWGYSGDHVGYILPNIKEDWLLGGTEGTTTFWGWKQGGRLRRATNELAAALVNNQVAPPADEFDLSYNAETFVPAPALPSLRPGRVVAQPENIERFATTTFVFEGGDPVVDLPRVEMQRRAGEAWAPVRRANGEIIDDLFEMHLEYALVTAAHLWTVTFEPPKDWPAGEYRIAASGRHALAIAGQAPVSAAYALESGSFMVTPSPSLQASAPSRAGGRVSVTLAYTPRPDNYRLIDPFVSGNESAPVRAGSVTFNNGVMQVADNSPDISADNRTATYSAIIPSEVVSVSGRDDFGNTTPAQAGGEPGDGNGNNDAQFDACFPDPRASGCPFSTVLGGLDPQSLESLPDDLQGCEPGLDEQFPTCLFGAVSNAVLRAGPDAAPLLAQAEDILAQTPLDADTQIPRPPPFTPEGFTHYRGNLHQHSSYSDGDINAIPATYFAQSKARGMAFTGSSEHSDNANLPIPLNADCLGPALIEPCLIGKSREDSLRKWPATLEQARAASDENYVAFRGFEWSNQRQGHTNIFFSDNFTNAVIDGGMVSMDVFWEWFTRRPEVGGGADGLASFNHPGREDPFMGNDPAFTWDDFKYIPEAAPRVIGIEVFNRSSRDNYVDFFMRALNKGWRLAPVGSEDHHGLDSAAPDLSKTVLIAHDLSEPALREAMLNRRMYALLDDENTPMLEDLCVYYSADGQPMGSRLGRPAGTPVEISARVTWRGSDGQCTGQPFNGSLDIFSTNGVVASGQGSTLVYQASAGANQVGPNNEAWYFLRVSNADGVPVAYAAPVWIRAGGAYAPRGEWVAGDLHVHSTYSHDSYGGPGDDNTGPDEFFTLGHSVARQFRIGASRGLDYLAITDHNDVRAQTDDGFARYGVIGLGGYENSLSGHAQMLGARKVYEDDTSDPRDCGLADNTQGNVQKRAGCLRADGGIFQINHPAGESTDFPGDAD